MLKPPSPTSPSPTPPSPVTPGCRLWRGEAALCGGRDVPWAGAQHSEGLFALPSALLWALCEIQLVITSFAVLHTFVQESYAFKGGRGNSALWLHSNLKLLLPNDFQRWQQPLRFSGSFYHLVKSLQTTISSTSPWSPAGLARSQAGSTKPTLYFPHPTKFTNGPDCV